MSRTLANRPARLALALVALVALSAPPARAQATVRYPRLADGGQIHGDGLPYLDSLGTLDPSVLDVVARHDVLILDVSPVTEYHPEILAALRARNPQLKALGYVLAENIWDANAADSALHFPTRYNHMIRDMDGHLYDRQGRLYPQWGINIAKRDANGNYVVAEAIANLVYSAVVSTHLWDGLFVDMFNTTIGWAQTPSESIDVVRAGYPNTPAFDAGWRAGSDTLASRLRALCGPDFILVGNGGPGTKYAWMNGWNRENFPLQDGGSWTTNMFADTGGYFIDEQRFRKPTYNMLLASPGNDPFDAAACRQLRYGLASATLGTGFATFGPLGRVSTTPPFDTWWYDEYAVDLTTGAAVADRAHTGWLGTALGPAYQMIWTGDMPDAVTNPDFETDVTTGWKFSVWGQAQATLTRDTTTAAVGHASAHVAVSQIESYFWAIVLQLPATMPITPGEYYALTFWARAVQPRTLQVAVSPPSSSSLASGTALLDGTWRQFQIPLMSYTGGSAYLQFFFGDAVGDVWLDDVHFEQGITSLWRRDFENGSVFVNPSIFPMSAPLSGSWRHILGSVDPLTNDGSATTRASVPSADGLFLIRTGSDSVPPATVRDVRITP